jgi:flagellar hook-associated protein 2
MGMTLSGLSGSGIDTQSLINQLIELEYTSRVEPLEKKNEAYSVKISAYGKIKTLVSDLAARIKALNETTDFNVYQTSSSDEDSATITGDSGCQPGGFDLRIYHTATREKLASTDGLIKSQSASLATYGISAGTISIDGTEIAITADDSIQDVRSKINNATDSDGERLNVAASVIKVADNNYRLVLTDKNGGQDGIAYKDVSGSTLQDLGIIQSADGAKDITSQQLSSSIDVASLFSQLTTGSVISLSGSDHDGAAINSQITISDGMSAEDFLNAVEEAFHNAVSASFAADGSLQLSDKLGGSSRLSLSFDSFGGAPAPAMTVSQTGSSGKNVLVAGSDAFFTLDGMNMESDSNEPEDLIPGATLHLLKASPDTNINLSIDRDTEALQSKIQAMVDAYNTLHDYIKTETKYAESTDESSADGDLAGDMTAASMLSKVRNALTRQFSDAGGIYKNLASIGITTDSSSGQLSVDGDKLQKALDTNFEDVLSLFVTQGNPADNSFTYGRSDAGTNSGSYQIRRTDDGASFEISLDGSSDWYTAALSEGIAKFSDGPAAGLWLTVGDNAPQSGQTTAFTFSRGLGDTLLQLCDSLTASSNKKGQIAMRQDSLQDAKEKIADRISTQEDRLTSYQQRLIKQYSAMEQAISTMNSQMSNMLSSLSG